MSNRKKTELIFKMNLVPILLLCLFVISSCKNRGQEIVSIGLTKMNVMYRGVENPVTIAVSGVPSDEVKATIDNGVLKQTGNEYSANPVKLGTATITVTANGKTAGTYELHVKDLPDPTVRINGQSSGQIDTASLFKAGKLTAETLNSEFPFTFKIIEFTMSCSYGGFTYDKTSKSDMLTPEQIIFIKKLKPGIKIQFEDIKVLGPEGTPRTLGPVIFELK
jgi:hypothetical protein